MDHDKRALRRRSLILIAVLAPFSIGFATIGAYGWAAVAFTSSIGMVSDIASLRAVVAYSGIPASQAAVIDAELAEIEHDARWLRVEPQIVDSLVNAVEADLSQLSELERIEAELNTIIDKSRLAAKEKQQAKLVVLRLTSGMRDREVLYRDVMQAAGPIRSKSYAQVFDPAPYDSDLKKFLFDAYELVNRSGVEARPEPLRYDKTICITIFKALDGKLAEDEYADFW